MPSNLQISDFLGKRKRLIKQFNSDRQLEVQDGTGNVY